METSRYNFILYSGEYGYWFNAFTGRYFRLTRSLSKKAERLLVDLGTLRDKAEPFYTKLRFIRHFE
jgi:hypothetical protein